MSSSERVRPSVLRSARVGESPCVVPSPIEPAAVRREAEEARLRESVEASYRKGLAEGEARARRELEERAARALNGLAAAQRSIAEARNELLQSAEDEVLELVLALARKIIARETEGSTDVVKGIIRELLAAIADRSEIVVRVSPQLIDDLREMERELGHVVSSPEGIRWVPDRRVSTDGVVVETESGAIDASVESQLEEAARLFKGVTGGSDA